MTPADQVLYLCHVGLFSVIFDQANYSCVISKCDDGAGVKVATQSCVYREYSRGLKTQPWGAPVLRMRVEEVCLPTLTTWDLPVRR